MAKVKVKARDCGCTYSMNGTPLPWMNYTCKVCGTSTDLLLIPTSNKPRKAIQTRRNS